MTDVFPLQKVDNTKVYAARDDLYLFVGAYIEGYKRKHKVSDRYIASAIGCSKQAIQSVRVGTAITSLAFVARIAAVFGMTLPEILIEGKRLRDEGLLLPANQKELLQPAQPSIP